MSQLNQETQKLDTLLQATIAKHEEMKLKLFRLQQMAAYYDVLNNRHPTAFEMTMKRKLDKSTATAAGDATPNGTETQPAENKKSDTKKQNTAKEKKPKEAKEKKPKAAAAPANDKIDFSRLKVCVGQIVDVEKHPDADALYVEKIDLGEDKPRTIISGLVKHVPIDEMRNRFVAVMANLKPVKMRGILSEGMVLCASTPEKVELLTPPADAKPGDVVICKDYPGQADEMLNPKKKIWEQIAPDLAVDGQGRAKYKECLLEVEGKGGFNAPSLTNCPVK